MYYNAMRLQLVEKAASKRGGRYLCDNACSGVCPNWHLPSTLRYVTYRLSLQIYSPSSTRAMTQLWLRQSSLTECMWFQPPVSQLSISTYIISMQMPIEMGDRSNLNQLTWAFRALEHATKEGDRNYGHKKHGSPSNNITRIQPLLKYHPSTNIVMHINASM